VVDDAFAAAGQEDAGGDGLLVIRNDEISFNAGRRVCPWLVRPGLVLARPVSAPGAT
jgi:hypothetical protein